MLYVGIFISIPSWVSRRNGRHKNIGREMAIFLARDFIEYLSDNDVPVVDYDQDEITREFETVEKLSERLKK